MWATACRTPPPRPLLTDHVSRITDHVSRITDQVGDSFPLSAGDDASRAIWLDVNPANNYRYRDLYASHREWVDHVAETLTLTLSPTRSQSQTPRPPNPQDPYSLLYSLLAAAVGSPITC